MISVLTPDRPDQSYFIEKKEWTVDQLLQTRLTEDEATEIMRADTKEYAP